MGKLRVSAFDVDIALFLLQPIVFIFLLEVLYDALETLLVLAHSVTCEACIRVSDVMSSLIYVNHLDITARLSLVGVLIDNADRRLRPSLFAPVAHLELSHALWTLKV